MDASTKAVEIRGNVVESAAPPAPPPICANCRQLITGPWSVTSGAKVFVICGDASCERWARAQGLGIYTSGFGVRDPNAPAVRPPSSWDEREAELVSRAGWDCGGCLGHFPATETWTVTPRGWRCASCL